MNFIEEPEVSSPMTLLQRVQALLWIVGILGFGLVVHFLWPTLFYNCAPFGIACP